MNNLAMNQQMNPNVPKLYGLFIHNLSDANSNNIAMVAMERFLDEKPPLHYQDGDVIILLPNHEPSLIMGSVLVHMGYTVDYIDANRFYALRDKIIVHYLFLDEIMSAKKTNQIIFDWEIKQGLSLAETRTVRIIKAFSNSLRQT